MRMSHAICVFWGPRWGGVRGAAGGGREGLVRFPADEPPEHIPRAEDREPELSGFIVSRSL